MFALRPLGASALLLLGACKPAGPSHRIEKSTPLDSAIARATDYLIRNQSDNGAWVGKQYSAFSDGRALTPAVLSAIHFAPSRPGKETAYTKGVDFVATLALPNGKLNLGKFGLNYPTYALAGAVLILNFEENQRYARARTVFVRELLARQLSRSHGWRSEDHSFGGWGYHQGLPKRPSTLPRDPGLLSANITSTLFSIGALSFAGGVAPEVFEDARRFVHRCQNFGTPSNDGGFFFTPDSPVQNKAGPHPKGGFRSYGTMTSDGLRLLLRLGHGFDSPRVQAAWKWLVEHFDPKRVPGIYPADRQVLQDSGRYYWSWSVAHTLARLETQARAQPQTRNWAETLSQALIGSQRPDGSFVNPARDVREDDPMVATPLALSALLLCQRALQ